jgi:GT2 family glycosyltransferase
MDGQKCSLTIVVPTYKRVSSLIRCLESIENQTIQPDAILVTAHSFDSESLVYLRKSSVPFLEIKGRGVVEALVNAIDNVKSDLIGIIDDDVTLPIDWVKRAVDSFGSDAKLGALGGTDVQPNVTFHPDIKVGRMTIYGKLIGNHHLASGSKREVDFLKGCNMVMRTSIAKNHSRAIRLLRGYGAQVGVDLVLSITSRIAGYRTEFNPNFKVNHHVAPRVDSSQRHNLDRIERQNLTFNLVLIKCMYSKNGFRVIVLFYQVIIGDREVPGLIRSLILNRFKPNLILDDLRILFSVIQPAWNFSKKFRMPLPPLKHRGLDEY